MKKFNVIEISTGKILVENLEYEDCLVWIREFGNAVNHTIVPNE